jgi:tRNA-Thr(GGU) m(6)t(6)A37 methyltransferase TsaA
MNEEFQIKAVGSVRIRNDTCSIQVDEKFLPALTNIDGFSHLQVVWWGHLTDSDRWRNHLLLDKLFKKGPDQMGVFATRSPVRPNPILVSTIEVQAIDFNEGIIYTPFIDAEDQTPVLDIKPYYWMERVRGCKVPTWCQHWPLWFEDSLAFDWREEMVNR